MLSGRGVVSLSFEIISEANGTNENNENRPRIFLDRIGRIFPKKSHAPVKSRYRQRWGKRQIIFQILSQDVSRKPPPPV